MSTIRDAAANLLGSATAGIISRFLCHPIDTIKSRVQTSSATSAEVIRRTLRDEGWRALFRGVGPVVVGGVPGVCMYLTSYEYVKEQLTSKSKTSPFLVYMTAGFAAETFCCIVFVPVDVIKERMQISRATDTNHAYNSSIQATRHILREEGIRGIYRGYGATLASYGPFSCVYFLLYEELKANSTSWYKGREIPFLHILSM